jgi:branched-chain amino acid transport system permease protein
MRHERTLLGLFVVAATAFAFFVPPDGELVGAATLALAYTAMALGLNIIVGFAGLLDLGYVAFFTIGSYTIGWFGSMLLSGAGGGEGIHLLVSGRAAELTGVHANFLLVVLAAVALTTIAGMLIGVPTLRLRGDYIAIVTLAFGEIVTVLAANGDTVRIAGQPLTLGRKGVTPIDKIDLPFLPPFTALELRPWYFVALALAVAAVWVSFALRDSRLGRAWNALRDDEAVAVAMGVPAVRTKLRAYGTGAAFGGAAGAFLGSYNNVVNAGQFEFSFSILILGMVILGGLGSVWGVVLGAILLSTVNFYVLPDLLRSVPGALGLDFDPTRLAVGIYGFLLVLVMLLRPEGLVPARRSRSLLHAGETARRSGSLLHAGETAAASAVRVVAPRRADTPPVPRPSAGVGPKARAGRIETLGAWLHLWTPPRDREVPPVPWRAVAVRGGAVLVAAGLAIGLGAPRIQDSKEQDSARERREAVANAAAFRARQISEQAPRRGALPGGGRRAAVALVEARIGADARARFDPRYRAAVCEPAPGEEPGARRLAYDCFSALREIVGAGAQAGARGQLGLPYRAVIDHRRRRYAFCKTNPPPGERLVPDPRKLVELPAACR